MNQRQQLEQALEIGRKELQCLVEGEVEQAQQLSDDRLQLMTAAFDTFRPEHVREFEELIRELEALQNKLTKTARMQKSEIARKLKGFKKSGKTVAAYSKGAGYSPYQAGTRFLSKKS